MKQITLASTECAHKQVEEYLHCFD